MNSTQIQIATALFGITLSMSTAWGQRVTDRRTAEIRGGGGDGKCTIEVVVDDTAEVEILGRNAMIRTISGSPASFRRFECNQEMPARPNNFRFKGIDGRGRQDMVRAAGDGGAGIIRIQDTKGGSEGYTFDIFWSGGSGGSGGGFGGGGFGSGSGGGFGNNRPGWGNNNGNGWGDGSGWGSNGDINFSGRGNGDYRDRNGRSGRLYDPTVNITRSGSVTVTFESDQGQLRLTGRVDRRERGRVYANVSGGDLRGIIEMDVQSSNSVRRIHLRDEGRRGYELNWSN